MLEEAGKAGDATFTIKERLEELKLLVPLADGAMYSGVHVMRMYDLEPSALVYARKELVTMPTNAAGRRAAQSAIQQMVEELQARPAEMSVPAQAPGDIGGMAFKQSLEEMWQQLSALNTMVQAMHHAPCAMRHAPCAMLQVAAEKARADRAEERADRLSEQIRQMRRD